MRFRKRTQIPDTIKRNNPINDLDKQPRAHQPKNTIPQTKPYMQNDKILKLPSVKYSKTINDQNYILNQIIGEGAFAKVRKAYRKFDDLPCVIKSYQKLKMSSQDKKRGIFQQIEILKNISHPNIIKMIDSYETTQTINIVMQDFSNQSLSSYTKQNQPLPEQTLKSITKSIADALVYLHQHKISHRDLKPENVLVNSNKQIKVIDLGLAVMGDHEQMIVAGTPQFMCPELINKKRYNPYKADIWAFGILLYWLTLGYYPQDNCKKKHPLSRISTFELKFPVDIHPGIQYLIEKMLQPDPEQRINADCILEDSWLKPRNLKLEIMKLAILGGGKV